MEVSLRGQRRARYTKASAQIGFSLEKKIPLPRPGEGAIESSIRMPDDR